MSVQLGAQVNNTVALENILQIMLLAVFSAFYHLDQGVSNIRLECQKQPALWMIFKV